MGDRPTIYDVARAAGVAASTVSRAYARPGRVNSETARLIFEAAERIGYRANPITGPLGRQTGAVGFMVSDITNPFYNEIIKGGEEAARLAGYALLLSDTSEVGPTERGIVERTLGPGRGRGAGQLPDERLGDPHDRQAEAAGAAEPEDARDSCIAIDNPAGCAAPSSTWPSSATTRSPTSRAAGQLDRGVRWRALREAGARAGAAGAPRSTRAATPTMRHRLRRGAPDRRRRRHRGARLQRPAGDRGHQGPQAPRPARCPAT